MMIKNFGEQIKSKIMFIDNFLSMYYKFFVAILISLVFFSCKEKRSIKAITINKNIIDKLQKNKAPKEGAVYIISLFTDNNKNLCEIVKCKESPTSMNFVGCQLLDNDTIFLYIDKKNKYLNCYKPSNKIIKFNKKQFTLEQKKEIKYYILDTLNCLITPAPERLYRVENK